MRRCVLVSGALLTASIGFGCDGSGGMNGDAATGGSAGSGAVAASGGTAAGGATGGVGTGGAAAMSGSAGTGEGGSGFEFEGICGRRGQSVVTTETFEGFEEVYIVGEEEVDEGIFNEYICAIRFDVSRVGDAPDNCGEFAGQQDECLWTHLVEFSNPQVVSDENGVCANSELELDETAIAEIDGSRVAYGYVSEYLGHGSAILQYEEPTAAWVSNGRAHWDPETNELTFDRRDGYCKY